MHPLLSSRPRKDETSLSMKKLNSKAPSSPSVSLPQALTRRRLHTLRDTLRRRDPAAGEVKGPNEWKQRHPHQATPLHSRRATQHPLNTWR